MSSYRRSSAADEDIWEILQFTIDKWGVAQAYSYYEGLERCLENLAHLPEMGRPCSSIMTRLRRFEHESHVIFYMIESGSIFICRVLHKSRMPSMDEFLDSLEDL